MDTILANQAVLRRPRAGLFKRYRPWLKGTGLLILAAGFSAAVGWGIKYSPTFALETIEVVGRLERLTQAQILKAAALQTGVNLFSLNLKELEARIAGLQWVRSVAIRRQVPGTLWIHLVEQEPKALLLADRLYFVSAAGVVFKALEGETDRDLAVITGLSRGQNLQTALQLIDFFAGHDLAVFGLSEIHYNTATGYSVVTLQGPVEVKLGRSHFETKLARLKKIWATLEARMPSLRGIDLNYEEKAVIKLL